ncbi:MAG: response regulator [Lentisphaeraceae bacterium]|nr:response regulator [Lentisphaeraceae bacterium]
MSTISSLESEFDDDGLHTILVADDLEDNVMVLRAFLKHHNYKTLAAYSGKEAVAIAEAKKPDLILLDLNMPEMNGLDVLKVIRKNSDLNNTGIILLTASGNVDELLRSFSVGADDFIQKPYHHIEMLARIQSVLKMRDTQLKLIEANKRLDEFNQDLEITVAKQVDELEKVNRLRRYFSPQVAETFLNSSQAPFSNERKEVTVVFLDLRSFTSFAENNSPDTVMTTLSEFHSTVGPIIFKHNATLERFTGDGMMCFLGAPKPEPDHAQKAFEMAIEMQDTVRDLSRKWLDSNFGLGLGIGISTGMASTGTIGFEQRLDYAAIGSVTNLSARLCGKAEAGEILLCSESFKKLSAKNGLALKGNLNFKGFSKEIEVYSFK